ncbi:MAG: urea ABC transporter permease subunit UrtC [Chloroflexota bacterium]|nr:urea ABC transporter permease subunit UrtC [Chloroflexota bacterium]
MGRSGSSLLARWGPLAVAGVLLFLVAPNVLDEFRLGLLAKFLAFAIVAVGLDLLWGYAGMLSLGHGVFFGIGAYAWAMYLKLEAVRASGEALPDFMTWSGLQTLPWFWRPFASPFFAAGAAIVVPMALAAVLGYLVCRSRITGVYFSLITQALALILALLIVGQQPYTGGTNGITNFSTMLGLPLQDVRTQWFLYFITAAVLVGVYVGGRVLVESRAGRLLLAVRDDENRVRFCGYNVTAIKVLVFAISAGLAGMAGALFVPQVGIISPAMLGIVPSIEMVIWVAVGGRGTLVGAIVGALLVNAAKSGLSESLPDTWQYLLGALFVGVVVLFPAGVVGTLMSWIGRWRAGGAVAMGAFAPNPHADRMTTPMARASHDGAAARTAERAPAEA